MNFYELLFNRGQPSGEGMTHFERLFAAKLAGGGEIKELEGVPPLLFEADGTPLLDYLISGNTVQTGTPTPTTPIQPQECGERTGQLIDYTQSESGGIDGSGNYVSASNLWRSTVYTPIDTALRYYISWDTVTGFISARINYYTAEKVHISREQIVTSGTALTVPQNAAYFRWTLYVQSGTVIDLSYVASLHIMLNSGSTPLPYEPWGIKIPISSAGQTTNIYLGEVQTTRKIKKLVLTGEENIRIYSGAALLGFELNTTDMMTNSRQHGICTHFKPQQTGSGLSTDGITFGANNKTLYITLSQRTIDTFDLSDIQSISSWLAAQYAAGTPVTVWYVLNASETAVVNEPLMRIGDYSDTLSMEQAGVQIPTANGSTTLDVETTVKPSSIYIKYKT